MTDPYAEVEIVVRRPGDVRKLTFPRVRDFRFHADPMIDAGDSTWMPGGDNRVISVTRRGDMDVRVGFTALYDDEKGHVCVEENTP